MRWRGGDYKDSVSKGNAPLTGYERQVVSGGQDIYMQMLGSRRLGGTRNEARWMGLTNLTKYIRIVLATVR